MSFGVGLGDIVMVATLTWKLYKSCKESSEDFRRLTTELGSLHVVLSETRDYLEEHGEDLADSRKKRLFLLMDGCHGPLNELEALYERYESLSTQAQRSWDRMRFGLKDLSDVRQRLVTHTTMLTTFNSTLVNSSTMRIEKKLNKFITEVQAGMREGSVISDANVATTIQSPDVWAELRRELEDIGISAVVVEERREFIVEWLKDAFARGLLEGNGHIVGIEDAGIIDHSFTPEGFASRCSTPTNDDESISSRSRTPTTEFDHDSGYYTNHSNHDDNLERTAAGQRGVAMNAATSAFTADVRRNRNERNVAEVLDPLAASTIYSLPSTSSSPTAVRTRRSTFGLVEKLFQKQTAIVQAASDGDIDRVARLLSLGMDVNAVDRWGWSALSMCGYGGYVAIARLLLDHGAKIDNVDVDGDTPASLAEQRGHANIVIMLEEEAALRKLRASEATQNIKRPKSNSI